MTWWLLLIPWLLCAALLVRPRELLLILLVCAAFAFAMSPPPSEWPLFRAHPAAEK